jgi:cobalt/nickel transport protein
MTANIFQNRKLEILTLVAIFLFIVSFLMTSSSGEHEFMGSDNVGSEKIAEISGVDVDSFEPLIPQYEPPSGEIEGALFALQATFGGLILGLIFGYWIGQRKSDSSDKT